MAIIIINKQLLCTESIYNFLLHSFQSKETIKYVQRLAREAEQGRAACKKKYWLHFVCCFFSLVRVFFFISSHRNKQPAMIEC